MGYGNQRLDSAEYDNWLSKNKKEKELRARNQEKKLAHKKDGSGWHFGIDSKPVLCKDKDDFRKQLKQRGLAIKGEERPDGRRPN